MKENVLNEEEGNILFNDMQHPTDRIIHTTAFVTPVVEHWLEQEIAQWVHPMKDRSDDPSHHEQPSPICTLFELFSAIMLSKVVYIP